MMNDESEQLLGMYLDSFFSTPLPPPTAVAPASVAQMDSPAKSFTGLRLVIEKHPMHKVEWHNEENREYTVSNQRTFNVEVALLNESNELARDVHVRLYASLLYENGLNVLRPNDEQETILSGQTEVVIIGGRGLLKPQLGKSALTIKHNKQRFRVNIAPNSELLCAQFPKLTVLSEPFKSVTKLGRKSRPPHEERLNIPGPHGEHGTRPLLPVLPAASSFTVAHTLAATAAPVGIKGHEMGTCKRLTDMNATQLNSCLSLPQRGPLGQPVARAAEMGGPQALALALDGRTGRSLGGAPVAATLVAAAQLPVATVRAMDDEMIARLPVRLPRTSRQQAGMPVAAAPSMGDEMMAAANIPAPMSAEEASLRAELMWDRLLT